MIVKKGTQCFLSVEGYYNIVYISDDISEFNCDCHVQTLPYLNNIRPNYIAVRTRTKYIGLHEEGSSDPHDIIVWIHK